MNRPGQNNEEMGKAVRLDPQNPILRVCSGWHTLFSGDADSAVTDADRATEMAPNLIWGPIVRGWAFQQQGKLAEAVAEFDAAHRQSGGVNMTAAYRGHALALAGDTAQAESIEREFIEKSQTSYVSAVSAFEIAAILVGLADLGRTFEWLEKAGREPIDLAPSRGMRPPIQDCSRRPPLRRHSPLNRSAHSQRPSVKLSPG